MKQQHKTTELEWHIGLSVKKQLHEVLKRSNCSKFKGCKNIRGSVDALGYFGIVTLMAFYYCKKCMCLQATLTQTRALQCNVLKVFSSWSAVC